VGLERFRYFVAASSSRYFRAEADVAERRRPEMKSIRTPAQVFAAALGETGASSLLGMMIAIL